MQNNLRMKTLKPIIKDAEPNKYMLEEVKSCDPGHAPFEGVSMVMWPTSKFGDLAHYNFWTEEARHLLQHLMDQRHNAAGKSTISRTNDFHKPFTGFEKKGISNYIQAIVTAVKLNHNSSQLQMTNIIWDENYCYSENYCYT